jgi:Uma2 family endonuclease
LTGRLHAFLGWHVIQNHLGAVFAAETGFRLSRPGGPATVRGADIAFLSRDRLPSADDPGFLTVPPDLVVETVSPSDRASALAEKVGWWLTHGARLVWVLDPQNRLVTTHHPDGVARVYRQNDTLQAEEVVPGFSLPLADLFVSGG